jgi:hypothetical protein
LKFISPLNIVFYFLLVPLLVFLGPAIGYAQSNFYKLGVAAGFGVTQSFGDVYNKGTSVAAYAAADYYFTPYVNIGLEYQRGKIIGGDKDDITVYQRQFKNDYRALLVQGKAQLGILIDYQRSGFLNAIRGLYVGGGIGVVKNEHKSRVGVREGEDGQIIEVFPGTASSKEVSLPLNVGINIYYPDRIGTNRFILNFNYQTNISFGEGLDSYDNSVNSFKTGVPDMYVFLTAGIRYQFGIVGLSRKSFRKF